ncbi:hypothetical protein [Marinoscillum sp.]|uniref:hypothetical protein n=1 Tax=Marinoscillum sp. TaxID=2024838 RepID=UPI003BAB4484
MKNRYEKALGLLYFGIIFLIFLLIVVSIVAVTFTGAKEVEVNNGTFGLILAGITITLASSIIIPKITLEKDVKEEVAKGFDEAVLKFRGEIEESYHKDLYRTDAHLSKMIAFFLFQDQPIWSIGWTFRSFKRYVKLGISSKNRKDLNTYKEFAFFLSDNLKRAESCFFDSLGNDIDSRDTLHQRIKDRIYNVEAKYETNESDLILRTCKDVLDFEFNITYNKVLDNYGSDIQKETEKMIKNVSVLVKCLLVFFEKERTKEITYNKVIGISEYYNDGNYQLAVNNLLNKVTSLDFQNLTYDQIIHMLKNGIDENDRTFLLNKPNYGKSKQ